MLFTYRSISSHASIAVTLFIMIIIDKKKEKMLAKNLLKNFLLLLSHGTKHNKNP